jgi:transposase-like protein
MKTRTIAGREIPLSSVKVSKEEQCPNCRENRDTYIVWLGNSQYMCRSCGKTYQVKW